MPVEHRNSKFKTHNSQFTVTASQIGEYGYCSRAWWYKHVLKLPPNVEGSGRLKDGTRAHQAHGRSVAMSAALRGIAIALALAGVAVLVLSLLLR